MKISRLLSTCSPLILLSGIMAMPLQAQAAPDAVPSADSAAAQADVATSEFELEYEKFMLDNGLEVILQVDRSDPIVAFTTVIHAGSSREKPGRTGFAHFFEHMAFNDSENVPRGWNRKAIPEWGGQRNGGTNSDMTIYYEVVPKDAFDKIMWIDSDRLGYMINTVTQDALDKEKQVVKNEKRQRVDNAPYGYTQEVIRKNLYPEGHPYNWTVIGSLPDLQAATLADLKEFYSAYYGPNNATLSIVGDIDIAETKAKVQKWFGEIKRGPQVKPLPPMPVILEETKRLYFEDNFAKLPELRITFPTVQAGHPDETPLSILGSIIAGSKNSVMYKQIVETEKLAPGVSGYNNSSEIAGEFVLSVRGNAGTDLDSVTSAIETAWQNFEENGVDSADLARIKAEQETILYARMETILGRANTLAASNALSGDPAYIVKEAEMVKAVTAEDVMAAYRKYVKGKPAIVTSFVPKGQTELAVEDSKLASVWIEEVKADVASEEVSEGEVADYAKTPSSFDRSEPAFGELPLVTMPPIWERALTNDIRLLGIENSETPLVTFDITIPGGSWNEAADKAGATRLLASLMNEGTANKTPADLERAIGLLGAGISVSSNDEETVISGTTLARNFAETMALVEEMLTAPRFQTAEFEKVKSASLTGIKGREANPNSVAALAFNKLLYSENHPSGRPISGTLESVETITMDDMKDLHDNLLDIKPVFHVTGDISANDAAKAMAGIAARFKPKNMAQKNYTIPAQDDAGKVYFIDVPGSKQSVLVIGKLTVATTDDDAKKLDYTNEKLGGGISGDLSQVLRIGKGYTYGAFSGIPSGQEEQPFQVRTSVRANATGPSLEIISDMLINYGPEFTHADVETVQQKLLKDNTRAFESLNEKRNTLNIISKYSKSKKYVEEDQQELMNMGLADFKGIAQTYLQENEMTYVIVGDKATQLEPVQAFATAKGKGEVVELDIYGNVVE